MLAGATGEDREDFVGANQSFTARMPLLTATSIQN